MFVSNCDPGRITMARSKALLPNDFDNERLPELAIWRSKPEILLVSPKVWHIVEISTANRRFSTTASLKVSRQVIAHKKPTTGKWQYRRENGISVLSVVVSLTWWHMFQAHACRKRQICRWSFDAVCRSSRYYYHFLFGGHSHISTSSPSASHLFVDSFFELAVVEKVAFATRMQYF